MSFEDCVLTAALCSIEQDVPAALLPLTITNQAALLAGIEAGQPVGRWD